MAPRCRWSTAFAPFTYTSTAGASGDACRTRTAPSASADAGTARDATRVAITTVVRCIRTSGVGSGGMPLPSPYGGGALPDDLVRQSAPGAGGPSGVPDRAAHDG